MCRLAQPIRGEGERGCALLRQGLHGHHDCALQDERQGPPLHLPLVNALQQCLQGSQPAMSECITLAFLSLR